MNGADIETFQLKQPFLLSWDTLRVQRNVMVVAKIAVSYCVLVVPPSTNALGCWFKNFAAQASHLKLRLPVTLYVLELGDTIRPIVFWDKVSTVNEGDLNASPWTSSGPRRRFCPSKRQPGNTLAPAEPGSGVQTIRRVSGTFLMLTKLVGGFRMQR